MYKVDIVVPARDEERNIIPLVTRIIRAFKNHHFDYRIIYIVDKSRDDTLGKIKKLPENFPVIYEEKIGEPGKGYSLIQGLKSADAPYLAFIDADLQYPPEELPHMLNKLIDEDLGVVVGNRNIYTTKNFIRKFISRSNKYIFGSIIHGFHTDTQSGMKVFRKEVFEAMEHDEIGPWTFDVPLLATCKTLGMSIGNHSIEFIDRRAAASKVNIVKASYQIGMSSLRARFRPRVLKLPHKEVERGYVTHYNNKQFETYSSLPHHKSAIYTLNITQKLLILTLSLGIGLIFLLNYLLALQIVIGVLTIIYFSDFALSFYLIRRCIENPPQIELSDIEISELNDENLPIYSILCPLYKEANILPHFVNAISNISWPKDKLDVLLLLEENDQETLKTAEEIGLPDFIRVIVVPHSQPKTKPKACNYGLLKTKGEYVTIYDAEDKPDPFQLKKAYLAFQKNNEKLVCVQGKLNYFNKNHNWLTRLFTADYSLWFEVMLPSLQSINTIIPLGGTSNHFKTKVLRELHGWDPFNVTEDCDLGVRLFKEGYKTAIINSVTLEEANSNVSNWIRQRSRWIKGYLQTYFVHMRDFRQFLKAHKWHAILFQLIIGLRLSFILINPLMWALTLSYFVFYDSVGLFIESLYPTPVFYLAVVTLVFGNFFYLYSYMIGLGKYGHWDLVEYVFLVPVYWVLMSIAAMKAFYQLAIRPHYWEKTHHGLHFTPRTEFIRNFSVPIPKVNIPEIKVPALSKFNFPTTELKVTIPFRERFRSLKYNLVALTDLIFWPIPEGIKERSTGNNILIINWRDTRHKWAGGAEVYVHEIGKWLVRKGDKVVIFCGNDLESPVYEELDGMHIIRRGGFFTVYIWAALYYIFKLRNHVNIIVDSENGVPFFSPLYTRKPVIGLIHHVHRDIILNELKLPWFLMPAAYIAKVLETRVMPLLYRNACMITVSNSTRESMEKIGFGQSSEIQIIHPGVNEENFFQTEKTDEPTFLYLGRLKPYKSIDVAIKAFSQVVKKHPKARFRIAGFGEHRPVLEDLVKELELDESVEFLGKVSEEAKVKLLGESWVFVYPSAWEGWGISVIEANASGTPVIASNVPGLKDSVQNPHSGVLVEYGNVALWSEKMSYLVSDRDMRDDLSRESIKWAKNFTWQNSAIKLDSLIHNLLSKKPSKNQITIYYYRDQFISLFGSVITFARRAENYLFRRSR